MVGYRRGRILARLRIVRTARLYRDKPLQLAIVAFLLGVMTLGLGAGAYRFGPAILEAATELDVDLAQAARLLGGLFWLGATIVFAVRALGKVGTVAAPEGTFTSATVRDVAIGVMLAEFVFLLIWIVPPGIAFGLGLAISLGTPAVLVTIPLGLLAVTATSLFVGFPIGLAIRYLSTRFPFVVRHKMGIIIVVFLAYFAFVISGLLDRVIVAVQEPLAATPAGWFGDLLLLGLPEAETDVLSAVAVSGGVLLLAPVSVAVVAAIGARFWLSDPVLADTGDSGRETTETAPPIPRLDEFLARFGRARGALIAVLWRRAVRSPIKLLYASYPVLLLGVMLADIGQLQGIHWAVPAATIFAFSWAGGVLFTLNPLGDQGSVLPYTLLARPDAGTFLSAHVLAGLLPVLPVTLAIAVPLLWLSSLSTLAAVGLVLATPFVVAGAILAALGIGMAFPKFDAVSVTRSIETVIPSIIAFGIYTIYLLFAAISLAVVANEVARELLAALLTWAIPIQLSIGSGLMWYLGGVGVVISLSVPVVSYLFARQRYERYTLG